MLFPSSASLASTLTPGYDVVQFPPLDDRLSKGDHAAMCPLQTHGGSRRQPGWWAALCVLALVCPMSLDQLEHTDKWFRPVA